MPLANCVPGKVVPEPVDLRKEEQLTRVRYNVERVLSSSSTGMFTMHVQSERPDRIMDSDVKKMGSN